MSLDLDCNTTVYYTGDGSKTDFEIPFEIVEVTDVNVAFYDYISDQYVDTESDNPLHGWTVDRNGTNDSIVRFNTPVPNNQKIVIYRLTPVDPLKADFEPGFPIKAEDLDDNFEQLAHAIEDTRCIVEGLLRQDLIEGEDIYWKKRGETLYSNNIWQSSDCYVASAKAIDQRMRGLVTVQDPVPDTPNYQGQLWWDSGAAELFIYYEDGNSNQWVQASRGIGDAPSNGVLYGRQDSTWVPFSNNDGDPLLGDVSNAPANINYGRRSGAANSWVNLDDYYLQLNAGANNQAVIGTGTVSFGGDVTIAGDISSAANATFDGIVQVGGNPINSERGTSINEYGTIRACNSTGTVFEGYVVDDPDGLPNSMIFTDGTIQSGGNPNLGEAMGSSINPFGTLRVAKSDGTTIESYTVGNEIPTFTLDCDGRINGEEAGFNAITIRLEPDNDANYITTSDAEGNQSIVYNGPLLDVKAVLLDLQSRVQQRDAVIDDLTARIQQLEQDHATAMGNMNNNNGGTNGY